jgi:tetratricopeptide (TPR) repeat protein
MSPNENVRRQTQVARLQLCLGALLVLGSLPCCLAQARERASQSRDSKSQARSTEEPHPDRRLAALQVEVDRLQKRLLEVARQLLSDLPRNEEALTLMGIVYHGLGKNNLALECWHKALSINPRQPDILYNMGLIAMQQEQYGNAISYWQKALKMNPKMAGPNLAIGRALLVQGKHEQAVEAFGKELALAPNSIQCHHLLGQAYALLEDHAKAKEHYLKVVKSEPNHSDAHYGLFQACSRLGEKEQARTYVTRFRQLKSQTQHRGRDIDTSAELAQVRMSATRMYMGVSEVYISSGNYKKAENALMEALRVDPNQVACLKKLTTVYQRIGRPEAALETSQKVTVLEPKDPMGFLVMGTLALQLNRFDQAESALRRAVELAPRASVGYRELAKLHLKANLDIAQARVYAQKAVALQQTAENYYILSLVCARGGDKNTALVAIRQAMKLAPDNVLYRKMYDQIRRQP